MEHTIDPTRVHHSWDNTVEPVLRIASGDVVHYDLRMAGHGQIFEGSGPEAAEMDFDTLYHLAGPVHVEAAAPGDTLRVDILELEPGDWGWASVGPGLGLLPADFAEPWAGTFDLRSRGTVEIAPGIRIPTTPFLGTMGTHPDEPAQASAFPPHKGPGTSTPAISPPARPVAAGVVRRRALLLRDPHAAQGDGEVCVTAVECPMRATVRLSVEHRTIPGPCFTTAGPLLAVDESAGHFGTMGIDPDLIEGARTAVRNAIAWLQDEHGLSAREAYVLCSLAGDLKTFEIVDAGVWNVGITIPLSIFPPRNR